jgi:hypothetical protein
MIIFLAVVRYETSRIGSPNLQKWVVSDSGQMGIAVMMLLATARHRAQLL